MEVEVSTVEPTAFVQEAKPFASEVKTFPAPGIPPSISIVPPILRSFAIPTPPLTTKAPVLVEVELVVTEIVAAPVVVSAANVVAPVTPKVPPTVSLPVIEALDKVVAPAFTVVKVAFPEAVKVVKFVAPVTPRVPPTVALLVTVKLVKDDVPALRLPVKLNDVPVAAPIFGVTKVLFDKDSVPAKVANVPEVGKVTFVVPVEVIVLT